MKANRPVALKQEDSLQLRAVIALKPHPLNVEIYGDDLDEAFVDSIRTNGVLQPLLVTRNSVIIGGHLRYAACLATGITEVPVVVSDATEKWDILELLLDSNRQRVKTNEQLGREAQWRFQVEQEQARRRQATAKAGTHGGKSLPAISPEGSGDARDAAAKKLGIGAKKMEEAVAVVVAIDALKAAGKPDEADKLRAVLNTESVHRAHGVAKASGYLDVGGAAESKDARYVLLDAWKKMPGEEREKILSPVNAGFTFNRQVSDGIEWSQWSWNPITGCLHDCDYCWARDVAERFFEQGFKTSFYPRRLFAPANTKVPPSAANNVALKNVFTVSTGDLFGKWVPVEWINAVLERIRAAPQWNFLLLTKFPQRLANFEFPDNAWVGTSIDTQARVATAETAFTAVKAKVKWVSVEPMMERITFSRPELFDWIVVGGASKSTKTPEFRPPREWVNHLWAQADEAGVKLFEKTNLLERRREFPVNLQATGVAI